MTIHSPQYPDFPAGVFFPPPQRPALGAVAMPYLSRAADRPRSPMACNPATSAPTAAWCGRAPTGRRR